LVVKRAAQTPSQRELNRTHLTVSLVLAAVFGALSIGAWRSQGSPILSLEAALFSLSVLGLALYAVLAGEKLPSARKLILFLAGSPAFSFPSCHEQSRPVQLPVHLQRDALRDTTGLCHRVGIPFLGKVTIL
jgi:hypothetical protein